MRVGVDIDGVLYPFEVALRDYLLAQGCWKEEELSLPVQTWDFYKEWGLTKEGFHSYCNEAVDDGELFWTGEPYAGAREALKRLEDAGHKIIYITARGYGQPGQSEAATRSWLKTWDFPDGELYLTSDKTSIPVDFMIDDKVENCLAMLEAEVETYLLDRPWNKHVYADYRRIYSLDEYADIVLRAAELEAECDENTRILAEEVTVTSETGGMKGQKMARYDLIPAAALRQVAELYGKGAEKYADHNWRKGYSWSLSFAAMQRHSWQFWNGEDFDSETGCAHLASVAFHALSLLTFMEEQKGYDDRFRNPRSEGLTKPCRCQEPAETCEAPREAPAAPEGPSWTPVGSAPHVKTAPPIDTIKLNR